jgi:chromosomal replication initiation ATPase DnaA
LPTDRDNPARPAERGQLQLEFGHTPSLSEADLLVGEGNRLAYGHLMAFPNWPGPLTLLTGPAKSGKSHLARIWMELAGAGLAAPDDLEALSQTGGQTPLLIEDVDRLGYEEAALFHLLNQSMRDRRPLLLTARQAIATWPYRTDDLKSRARLATHLAVSSTDDIQLSQIFVKLFGDRQVAVDPRTIEYILPRMERSPEEAVVLVELMDRLALARGTAINRTIAAEALAQRYALRGSDSRGRFDLENYDDE